MNATCHYPTEIDLNSNSFKSERAVPGNLCNLRMRYTADGQWQSFHFVWVSRKLQSALKSGDVKSLHLETLVPNGPVSRALGYPADFLVMGVTKKSGERINGVPKVMVQAKRISLLTGAFACIVGTFGLHTGVVWEGALGLVLGSYLIRTARSIPLKPIFY